MPMPHRPGSRPTRTRGFSLIELLMVVAIIGVLVGVTFVASRVVINGNFTRTTEDLIRSLDNIATAYSADTGKAPLPYVRDPRGKDSSGQIPLIPVADARNMDAIDNRLPKAGYSVINSVGLFLSQASASPSAKSLIDTLPTKFVKQYDGDPGLDATPPLLTVMDPWDHPIRYVHPKFGGMITTTAGPASIFDAADPANSLLGPVPALGADTGKWAILKIRRTDLADATADRVADADGGSCVGGAPYFYSAGKDGLVGRSDATTKATDYNRDNIYTNKPVFSGRPPIKR